MDIKRIQAYPGQSNRELAASLLSVITPHNLDDLEEMSFREFDKLASKAAFCAKDPTGRLRRIIWINGTRYKLQDKVENYNPSTGLSLVHYRNTDLNQNWHNVLAWIYKPTFAQHNPDKAAADFLTAPITKVCAAFFLFYKKALRLKDAINAYREAQMKILEDHLVQVTNHFQSTGDGITSYNHSSKTQQAVAERK